MRSQISHVHMCEYLHGPDYVCISSVGKDGGGYESTNIVLIVH